MEKILGCGVVDFVAGMKYTGFAQEESLVKDYDYEKDSLRGHMRLEGGMA